MATQDTTTNASASAIPRRRKHQRACELCKRRKVLCDASEMPDNRCSRCLSSGVECVYDPNLKMRRTTKKYVEALESRLHTVENLLKKMHSDSHRTPEDSESDVDDQPEVWPPKEPCHASGSSSSTSSSVAPRPPVLSSSDQESSYSSEDESCYSLGGLLRFHGESSNMSLIKTVIDLKTEHSKLPVDLLRATKGMHNYYVPRVIRTPYRDFPSPEKFATLSEAYFTQVNIYLPLLHRQTFEDDVRDGLHLRDESFGSVVLLVSAIGSQWVGHHSMILNDTSKIPGFRWFEQIASGRWEFLVRPELCDLQACALAAIYLNAHAPQNGWSILAVGIRMALDVGAHRKKMYNTTPTLQRELWKRVFWVLVVLDWLASFGLGRPCAVNEEDFDIDTITEIDDEYLNHPDPALAFKQPEGKPSKVAFFNCMIRLLKIQAFALRTIYTINKSKLLFGFIGSEWKERIVAELDSSLNKWKDTIPTHLCWDPNREDLLFFQQSAVLYTSYYRLQICVHRQYVPSVLRGSPLSLPSMTICTNAARSCLRVLAAQYQRTESINYVLTAYEAPMMTAVIILLMNLWAGGRSERETREIQEDVDNCFAILKDLESTDKSALKIRAFLNAFTSVAGDRTSFTKSSRYTAQCGAQDIDTLVVAALKNIRISLSLPETAYTNDEIACSEIWCRSSKEPSPSPSTNGRELTPFALAQEQFWQDSQRIPFTAPTLDLAQGSASNGHAPSQSDDPMVWNFNNDGTVFPGTTPQPAPFPPDLLSAEAADVDGNGAPEMDFSFSQWFTTSGEPKDATLWSMWPTSIDEEEEWNTFMQGLGTAGPSSQRLGY